VKTSHTYNDHEKRVHVWRRSFSAHHTSPLTGGYVDLDGIRVHNVMTLCGNCHTLFGISVAGASLPTCSDS
jgi:hypothetical protein